MSKYIFILSILFCQIANAQMDLYDALVPVNSRDHAARIEATKQALIQVLIRLSGNRDLATKSTVKAQLPQAEQFVQQFTYTNRPEDGKLLLAVGFDPDDIDELMNTLGITPWNSQQATCLVWILLEENGQLTTINAEEQPQIVKALHDQAWQRGLPIVLPLLDLEDVVASKTLSDTPETQETVSHLMNRYRVEFLLLGRLSRKNAWEGHWRVYSTSKELSNWYDRQEQQQILFSRGLDKAVDTLANVPTTAKDKGTTQESLPIQPNVPTEKVEIFALQVINVPNLEDYAQLRDYLQSLKVITHLQVQSIQRENVTFLISATGGKTAVMQAIQAGHILIPVASKEMMYRFVK